MPCLTSLQLAPVGADVAIVLNARMRKLERFASAVVDNLGEEVRKGMLEKARQGHWPSFAPIGTVNSPVTRRIEPDPERATIIATNFAEK